MSTSVRGRLALARPERASVARRTRLVCAVTRTVVARFALVLAFQPVKFGMKHVVTAFGLAAVVSGCKGGNDDTSGTTSSERCAELDVPQLFVDKCSTAACHEGAAPAAALDLVAPGLETRIVLQPATQCAGVVADPSDPEGSVLVEKLRPSPSCGVVMPLGMEALPEEDVQCVVEWISGLVPPGPADGTTGTSGETEGETSGSSGPQPEMCTPGDMQACYSGLPDTEGVGMCVGGTQTCQGDATWGACEGEVAPLGEDCFSDVDENCDGETPACSETWLIGYLAVDNQQARAVAVDRSNGDVVVVGDFEGTVGFGDGPHASDNGKHDIFIERYDLYGNPIWTKQFGDSSNQYAGDVVIDQSGDIVLVGRAFGVIDFGGGPLDGVGTDDVFIARLDASGNHLWSTIVGGMEPDRSERVAVDPAGNVYVTGTFGGSATFGGTQLASQGLRDLFILKLSASDGSYEWVEQLGGTEDDYGWGVAADASGVYLTGHFGGSVSFGATELQASDGLDAFVGKYDPDGAPLWAVASGGAGPDQGYDIAVAPMGDVFVTGAFTTALDLGGTADPLASEGGRDIFLARLAPDGTAVWANGYGDAADNLANDFEENTWPGLAIGDDGTIFLAGSLAGTASFGTGDITSAGKVDAYLARIDPDGNGLSAQRWGGAGTEIVLGVDADANGNALLVGRFFASSLSFGAAGSITNYGNSDAYVVKLP
jgi:hypothetical protein